MRLISIVAATATSNTLVEEQPFLSIDYYPLPSLTSLNVAQRKKEKICKKRIIWSDCLNITTMSSPKRCSGYISAEGWNGVEGVDYYEFWWISSLYTGRQLTMIGGNRLSNDNTGTRFEGMNGEKWSRWGWHGNFRKINKAMKSIIWDFSLKYIGIYTPVSPLAMCKFKINEILYDHAILRI